jgi:hypothetical protein
LPSLPPPPPPLPKKESRDEVIRGDGSSGGTVNAVTVNGRVEVQWGRWFFSIDVKLFLNFQWLRELQTELANWH